MSTDTIFGFPVQVCDTLPYSEIRLVSDGKVLRLINVQDQRHPTEDRSVGYKPTPDEVKELRARSGCTMPECHRALCITEGNQDAAYRLLMGPRRLDKFSLIHRVP